MEPDLNDNSKMQLAISEAADFQMVSSTAQRATRVHCYDSQRSDTVGAMTKCGAKIMIRNANIRSAWDAYQDKGMAVWCARCKSFWPDKLTKLFHEED